MLVVLLAGICGICGISAIPQNDIWQTDTMEHADECDICDQQCYKMDKAKCKYYRLAKHIFGNDTYEQDQEDTNNGIDDMMFDYMEKVSSETKYKDCIPLMSQYTTCNRENVCIGCKTCSCGVDGLWNCSVVQRCRPDDELPLDHHTLVVVMENLREYKKSILNKRIKRSINRKKEVMSHEDVLKWMYDTKEYNINKETSISTTENMTSTEIINVTDTDNNTNNINKDNEMRENENISNDPNSEPLVFQDLLNNLNLKNDENHISLEDKHSEHTVYHELAAPNVFNDIKKSILDDTIILNYEDEGNKNQTNRLIDDVFAYVDSDVNENFNYKRDIHNTGRIQKREVGNETISSTGANATDKALMEIREVLNPLDKFVEQKQNELNKLIDIKKKFITYIKSITGINITDSHTNYTNDISHLYFIDLDLISNYSETLRKRDPNILNKYLEKLKRDIHEVVKDVVGIQRFSNYSSMPYELKILIRAMKNYVGRDKKNKIKNINQRTNTINLRKTFDLNIAVEKIFCPIDEVIKIFEAIDNNIPISNALDQLTPTARRILRRVVKKFYKNNITNNNSAVNLTKNITAALNKVGKNWDKMTIDIATVPLPDRLYAMKLFHLLLSVDIKKLADVHELVLFAQNRRMTINDFAGESLIGRISNNLRRSNHRLNHVIQLQILKSGNNSTTVKTISKKKTFLQTIKNLLKNSKKEINRLLKRKVPKNEIVKHIARQKMDEIRKKKIVEYDETMRKWQNNLNIASRYKREAGSFANFFRSIKNLIPGLRSYPKKSKTNLNQTENIKKNDKKQGSKFKRIATTRKTTSLTHKHSNYTRKNNRKKQWKKIVPARRKLTTEKNNLQ